MNEWISIKDKEPCVGSLVYDTNGEISIATEIFTVKTETGNVYITPLAMEILEGLYSKYGVSEIQSVTHITHWMPLPEPPKDNETITRYDKLKQEISAMSLEEFFKHFISGKGIREYICGDIRVPHAQCQNTDYDCLECIKDYLKSRVEE